MEELSEDLKSNLYYIDSLDVLIEENDMQIKNRLQVSDDYTNFLKEQSQLLMKETIDLIKEKEISFLEASSTVIDEWKTRTFR